MLYATRALRFTGKDLTLTITEVFRSGRPRYNACLLCESNLGSLSLSLIMASGDLKHSATQTDTRHASSQKYVKKFKFFSTINVTNTFTVSLNSSKQIYDSQIEGTFNQAQLFVIEQSLVNNILHQNYQIKAVVIWTTSYTDAPPHNWSVV